MNSENSATPALGRGNKMIIIIILSQFACTSLWFAGNAVMADLVAAFGIPAGSLGHLTSAVQFGFITGTLTFALFTISDRYSPSKVFFFCATAGAVINFALTIGNQSITTLLIVRFFTGFFLAGIYPVGMKIASDYYEKGLGKALGFLVGALVLGTALPHLLKSLSGNLLDQAWNWKYVIYFTSIFTALGGLSIFLFVPDGPFRKQGAHIDLKAIHKIFKIKGVRTAAFGYFGHMWELYTFWAFTPLMILTYINLHSYINAGTFERVSSLSPLNISLLAFIVIVSGSVSCAVGGIFSARFGSRNVARTALFFSCICCLVSPLMFYAPVHLFLFFLVFWGMAVVADSPQFSTLVAGNAPNELKGTALTIVNSVGFAITIISIEVFSLLQNYISPEYIYMILAIGPLVGLIALQKKGT